MTKLGIIREAKVSSAHGTPKATHDYVVDADKRSCAAFICVAADATITGQPLIR